LAFSLPLFKPSVVKSYYTECQVKWDHLKQQHTI
jgi:hypothetical protein